MTPLNHAAILRLGERRYLQAYIEQGTPKFVQDVIMLRNRAAASGIHNKLSTKRAQLDQMCTVDTDLNVPMPPSAGRAITVHLFGDSTTILSRKSGANRPIWNMIASLFRQNGAGETFHFADYTGGDATFQAILLQVADSSTLLPGWTRRTQSSSSRGAISACPTKPSRWCHGPETRSRSRRIGLSRRENAFRLRLATQLARLLRAFPCSTIATGHRAYLYGLPAEFDGHIADICVALYRVGTATTEPPQPCGGFPQRVGRRLPLQVVRHRPVGRARWRLGDGRPHSAPDPTPSRHPHQAH